MIDLGHVRSFLIVLVFRHENFLISKHDKYACTIVERVGIVYYNFVATSINTESKLSVHSSDVVSYPILCESLDKALMDRIICRPNITYVIKQLCHFMNSPLLSL